MIGDRKWLEREEISDAGWLGEYLRAYVTWEVLDQMCARTNV